MTSAQAYAVARRRCQEAIARRGSHDMSKARFQFDEDSDTMFWWNGTDWEPLLMADND